MTKTNGTREDLLQNKPTVHPFEIAGKTYYVRDLTVGDVNREVFEFRQWLIHYAEQQGITLALDKEEELNQQLDEIGGKYRLARNIATKLCDKDGNSLFNPCSIDDLTAINQLNDNVLSEFNSAIGEPKNSPNADDSN